VGHFPRTAGETSVRLSDIPKTFGTALSMWLHMHIGTAMEPDGSRDGDSIGPAVAEFIPASR
jgi:hypothetical protein